MKFVGCFLATFLFCLNAYSHIITQQEFTILNRVANLCKNCQKDFKLGVFYDENDTESITDLDSINSFAKNNYIFDVTNISDEQHDFSQYNLVIFAAQVEQSQMKNITEKLKKSKTITASSDVSCIQSQSCFLSVDIANNIRILVNEGLLKDTKAIFKPELYLLIN